MTQREELAALMERLEALISNPHAYVSDLFMEAKDAIPTLRDYEKALEVMETAERALGDILDHVEDLDVERINNECTLCHTYRSKGYAALAALRRLPSPEGGQR